MLRKFDPIKSRSEMHMRDSRFTDPGPGAPHQRPGFVMGDQILRGATDFETLQAMIRAAREHRQ